MDMQFRIQSINDLHERCKERVARDNEESVYLPNPVFTDKPKYCLVAMEPSIRGQTPKEFQNQVDQGFKNFLCYPADFILHYCAKKFLCHEYYITDISKGAMKASNAEIGKQKRYENWRSILQQELDFFGNPKLIAIGGAVEKFLKKEGFPVEFSVWHFSQMVSPKYNRYYAEHPEKHHFVENHTHLKRFATEILETQKYPPDMQNKILNRLFNSELKEWHRGMFLYYRDKFSVIGDRAMR